MIRKLILPLFLALAFAMNAQVDFGVHAGVGFTTVTTPNLMKKFDMNFKYKFSPMVGITTTIEICSFMHLQPELNLTWRGFTDELIYANVGEHDKSVKMKVNSLYGEIPVMFKFYPSSTSGFNLQVGPQVGVLLSRNESVSGDNLHLGHDNIHSDDNNSIDFGFNLGLGYSFYQWDIDLRYYFGLVKTYHDLDACKNRGFQLALGYRF